jgi:hypothetical protein
MGALVIVERWHLLGAPVGPAPIGEQRAHLQLRRLKESVVSDLNVAPAPRRRLPDLPPAGSPAPVGVPAVAQVTSPQPHLPQVDMPAARVSAGGFSGQALEQFTSRSGVEVTVLDSGRKDAGTGKVKKPRGKNLATPVGPRVRPQQRDLFWMEIAARFKFVSYAELAGWAKPLFPKTTEAAVRQRMHHLLKAGVFDAWDVFGSRRVVTLTGRAAARHGLEYLIPNTGTEPKDLTLLHTAAVARTGLMLWAADPVADRHYVLTEREVRAVLRNGQADLLVRDTDHWGDQAPAVDADQWVIPGPEGFVYTQRADGSHMLTGGYRLPDLTLLRRGLPAVAVEVELSAKTQEAYMDLFACYLSAAGQARYAGVQYYCGSRHVAGEVMRAVRKVPGAEAFIRVDEFPTTMPLPLERIQRITGRKIGAQS